MLFLLTSLACSSTKEHTNYKYGKNPQMLQQPTLLRTDGVYVYVFNYEGKNKSYRFLRFFENGRCFASKHFDGAEMQKNSLLKIEKKDDSRTFYRNKGNEIIYENWGGSYALYVYNFCTVDSLGLNYNGYKSRSWTSSREIYPQPNRYNFVPIDFKNKTADW